MFALFFGFHYGLFCLVHAVFTGFVAYTLGVEATFLFLGLPIVLIVIRYTVEVSTVWFGAGQREVVSPAKAMLQPYPRIIVLHVDSAHRLRRHAEPARRLIGARAAAADGDRHGLAGRTGRLAGAAAGRAEDRRRHLDHEAGHPGLTLHALPDSRVVPHPRRRDSGSVQSELAGCQARQDGLATRP